MNWYRLSEKQPDQPGWYMTVRQRLRPSRPPKRCRIRWVNGLWASAPADPDFAPLHAAEAARIEAAWSAAEIWWTDAAPRRELCW